MYECSFILISFSEIVNNVSFFLSDSPHTFSVKVIFDVFVGTF